MALIHAFRELADAWLILVLTLDLVFFAYLAFRLGRDGEILGLGREGLPLDPAAVRAGQPSIGRRRG